MLRQLFSSSFQMSFSSHLLFFTLLCPIPRSAMPPPSSPSEDLEELPSSRSHVQDAHWLLRGDPGPEGGQQELLLRAQREVLASPLSRWHLRRRRQGDGGGRKKEPLSSMAGGLQAVSREKGGFGFRFGRRRRTERRRRKPRRSPVRRSRPEEEQLLFPAHPERLGVRGA